YLQLTRQQIVEDHHPTISASSYFDLGTQVITQGYHLLHSSSTQMEGSFARRSQMLNERMEWVKALLMLVPLLIGYLVIAFFISTRTTLNHLRYVITQLQQHKVPKLIAAEGRDELAEIVVLFHDLSRQMIFKNEEERLLGDLSSLALRSESVTELCDRVLVLLMGAHRALGAKTPAHIQLVSSSGKPVIVAATYEASVLIIPDSTAAMHQLSFGDNPLCCFPLIYKRQRLGELLLTLDDARLLESRRRLFARVVDALVLAIVRLQAMQTLAESERRLLRSNEELERFAYVASHDLQEPLRKICSFGDRLQQKAGLAGRNLDFLMRMVDAAGRMQLLIQDLLAFSRIHASTRPFTSVDLNKVAEHAVDNLEVAIQESGGKVQVSPLPTVDGDPVQLEQLLQNLIGNALKYRSADRSPEIHLRLVEEQHLAGGELVFHFVCEDNGIGFEQVYAQQIFEAFKRLHGRREYSGSGIGLALCRRIVERHGGEIHATSAPDQGASIHFSLRAKSQQERL
ncbi:MAG: ATP-binding protein, partial [Mariprofundales bacterium]|nr:ATP-binding protein [Mariprofundales bacterium]